MHKPVKKLLSGITAVMLACSCFVTNPVSSYASDPDYKNWLQTDSRWGSNTIGSGNATIAGVGCLATSIAILAVHCGAVTSDSFNPGNFVKTMNDLGGFDYYGNLANWNIVEKAIPNLEVAGKYTVPSGTTESEYIEKLEELQNEGYYSICYVGNHWVFAEYTDGNTVYMCDPGSDSTDMFSRYPFNSYTHDTIRYFKYDGGETPDYQNGTYEITASALNLRENPDSYSKSLDLIPNGEKVSVTEISDGWGKTSYNGKTGWISMQYAKFVSAEITETTTTTTTVTTTTTTTTVMPVTTTVADNSYPDEYTVINQTADITDSENNSVLCTIPQNSVVKVTEINNEYAQILFEDSYALISVRDIAPVAQPDIIPEKGDVNGDGVVDKLDISTLNEYILAESELPENVSAFTAVGRFTADCNNDGAVDNNDVIQLLIKLCNNTH